MIKKFLKLIYVKYKKQLLWLAIADFMGEVPAEVESTALVIAWEKRHHFKKWLQYQSFLALRMSKERPQLQEMYYYWILFANFQMNMLEKDNLLRDEKPVQPDSPKVVADTLKEEIQGVQDFISRKKK